MSVALENDNVGKQTSVLDVKDWYAPGLLAPVEMLNGTDKARRRYSPSRPCVVVVMVVLIIIIIGQDQVAQSFSTGE